MLIILQGVIMQACEKAANGIFRQNKVHFNSTTKVHLLYFLELHCISSRNFGDYIVKYPVYVACPIIGQNLLLI